MLRQIDKDDVETIVEMLDAKDVFTFAEARKILGMDASLLSDIISDMLFFGLLTQDGEKYAVNRSNVNLWRKYNRELDYKVLCRSDTAKTFFNQNGVNADVPMYADIEDWDTEE